MLLKKVNIAGFGKFLDREFSFGPGLNVIFGPNESGKTTLAKFILYTLSELDQDALRYKPWFGEKFGGAVETTEGTFRFAEPSPKKLQLRVLETVSFVLEDDDLETMKVDRNVFEAHLRKKTERTEEGRILKRAISKLEAENIGECLATVTNQLREVEAELDDLRERVKKRNGLFAELKRVEGELFETQNLLESKRNALESLRSMVKVRLSERVAELRLRINEHLKELEKVSWVRKVGPDQIEELMEKISAEERLRQYLAQLEDESKSLDELIKRKNEELKDKLRLIGATSEHDLEGIELRLKHLNLLVRLYNERAGDTQQSDPLWQLFLETPNLLERAEDEEKRMEEVRQAVEAEKRRLQDELERREQRSRYTKDLSIVTGIAGVFLFGLTFLFTHLAVPLYLASSVLVLASVVLVFNSRREARAAENVESRLIEISAKPVPQSDLWRVLAKYGVTNTKTLRRKYEDFLLWKAENREKERRIQELKELEQEMIRELGRLGVAGATQMLLSAVENLQRNFQVVREVLAERETMERRRNQLWNEYLAVQRELRALSDSVEDVMKSYSLTREEVAQFGAAVERYSELSARLNTLENELRQVQRSLMNEDEDEEISRLKTEIRSLERKVHELSELRNRVQKALAELEFSKESCVDLMKKRDVLMLKVELLKKMEAAVASVRSYLLDHLRRFSESYHRTFGEEFMKFVARVVGSPRNFLVSPDLSVRLVVDGGVKEPSDFLTASLKDLILLGVKLALYKAFYDENVPLVIDNALIRLDDERLRRTIDYLVEESSFRQVILLTSDKRVLDFSSGAERTVVNLEG